MVRYLLTALIACFIFAFAFLVWRLARGPVALDFVIPYLEEAVRDPEQEWRIRLREVVLMSDLKLHARGVDVLDRDGDVVLNVPDVAVRPSLSALRYGMVAVQAVEIAGLHASIVRRADGSFAATIGGESASVGGDETPGAGEVLDDLLEPPRTDHPIGFLRLVRITGAHLHILDAESGTSLNLEHADLVFRRSVRGNAVTLKADLESGAKGAPTAIDAKLQVHPASEGLTLAGQLHVSVIDVERLGLVWPQNVAAAARRWVVQNIKKGQVPEVSVDLALHSERGADVKLNALKGSFRYEGLEVEWSDEAPAVTAVAGTATFDARGMSFAVAEGRSGDIRVGSAQIEIAGLDGDREHIAIDVRGRGPLAALIELVPKESNGIAAPSAIRMSGDSPLQVNVAFPLRAKFEPDDIELRVQADPKSLRLTGNELDAVVSGRLRYEKSPSQAATLAANLDVHEGRVDSGTFHWKQPVESKGKVGFRVAFSPPGSMTIDPLHVECAGLQAHGSASVSGSQRGSSSVNLRDVVFGATKLDALAAKWGRHGIVARLGRGALDLSPFTDGHDNGSGAGEDGTPPIDLEINAPALTRVQLDADSWLENVNARIVRENGRWRDVEVAADLPKPLWSTASEGRKVFSVSLRPTGTGRRLEAQADDLGALLRGLNVTDGIRSGKLEVSGRVDTSDDGDVLRAQIRATQFAVREAPLLLRLLTVAAFDRYVSTLRGEGLAFDALKGTLIVRGERYELDNFRARGSSLGWTAKGWIDTASDRLSISGALIPAYAANKVLRKIPFFGGLLTGTDRRGLIAINYQIHGSLQEPKVTTNPLTALTPGFLREVWELAP